MTIKYIDIIHHSHTDFGYTDHPDITMELHKNYIDLALDAIDATAGDKPGEGFSWTAEALLPVYEWWMEADRERRERLLKAIAARRFEVMGFLFNNTAFLNDDEWDMMFKWVPNELWQGIKPTAGMQIDVNGMPRAGIIRAIKKGMRYFWIGPNSYNGASPFGSPYAFRWNMPDGGSIFTWINSGYGDAFYLFNENWRQGPVPSASDLRYRQPDMHDIFMCSDEKLFKAHQICLESIKALESDALAVTCEDRAFDGNTLITRRSNYPYERLPVSLTNQWRLDNDPPFLAITEFIKKWNRMGLKPELRLTTPSIALSDLEKETDDNIPVYSGEWVDWWANGSSSMPVEMAASRKAKRFLKVVKSGVFGELDGKENEKAVKILKNLCMFDEHVWGSWGSIAYPYDMATRMQTVEKCSFAYKALAASEYLLAEKARAWLGDSENGIYVVNVSKIPAGWWIELPVDCLRGDYRYIKDCCTGEIREIVFEKGIENFKKPEELESFSIENVSHTFSDMVPHRKASFWSGIIMPESTIKYELLSDLPEHANIIVINIGDKPNTKADFFGWPESISWVDMQKPLFEKGLGEFISYSPVGFAPRWIMKDIFETQDIKERLEKRNACMIEHIAVFHEKAVCSETPYTISYEQVFSHPSLVWGKRLLVVWKNEPRIRLTIRINRRPSMDPEIFYIKFPLPCHGRIPKVSNGGISFIPGEGQLPGSCMDYYAIDGWAHYSVPEGNWIWTSQDAPLITFEKPNAVARLDKLPDKTGILLSMVFDNTWDTNFAADSHGIMEFNYNIMWHSKLDPCEVMKYVEGLENHAVVAVKTR